jgi:hypothetical protein
MTTLITKTAPTPDLNIDQLNIDLQDFDAHLGVTFMCTFLNPSSTIIDRKTITMCGTDWQNWGPSVDPQADYDYVINFCIAALGLNRKPN